MNSRKTFFIAALTAGLISGAVVGYLFAWYAQLPDIKLLQDFQPPVVTKIYSDDGRLIGELFQEKRELLKYDQIPQDAINGVVATEDTGFFEHHGIQVVSIFRALVADIRAGKFVQGGSTITQQLSKTLFLTPEKTILRKIKEALIALQIERNYTKEEILALYFNQIYFGSGAYGLEAAAQVYFNKHAGKLTLAECALIAGLPRAPSYYSPHKSQQRALGRRAVVLKRMSAEGFITREQKEEANQSPLTLSAKGVLPHAPYFIETIRIRLEEKYGSGRIYREGLEVYTTMNVEMQESAQLAIAKGLEALEKRIVARGGLTQEERPPVQAALIAIEPSTGEVKAMVGGKDFSQSVFNRALQAKRQPGSAFKPIIYAAALTQGYTPADIIYDSPIIMDNPSKLGKWKPQNFSKKFYGPVTLRHALEKSLNVATIKLMQQVGAEEVINLAGKLGINSKLSAYPSLALGAEEVTLAEITTAYGVFANHGQKAERNFIRLIKKRNGEVLEKNNQRVTEVMSEQTAYLISKMLQGVIENGTGRIAKKLGVPSAAKTGTTDNFTDAWFVGFTPSLAVGVWVGYDLKRTLGKNETGARVAGPIWTQFMMDVAQDSEDFIMPDKIVEVEIDAKTGLLADPSCGKIIKEYFLENDKPTRNCNERVSR